MKSEILHTCAHCGGTVSAVHLKSSGMSFWWTVFPAYRATCHCSKAPKVNVV